MATESPARNHIQRYACSVSLVDQHRAVQGQSGETLPRRTSGPLRDRHKHQWRLSVADRCPAYGPAWELRSGMAYSQRILSVEELFYQRDGNDCPGYDEWYVFDATPNDLGETLHGNPFEDGNKPRPGRLLVFVGWAAFVFHGCEAEAKGILDRARREAPEQETLRGLPLRGW